MLFMTVFTYEPAQRDEVVRRRAEKGTLAPQNVKVLGDWSYLGGGRVFRLVEVDEPTAMVEAAAAWTDLGKLEVFPVLDVEKVLPHLLRK
jgi:hypothetical protein